MPAIMALMVRPSTFALHDRLLDGHLEAMLRGWRADGVSFTEMSHRLRDRDQIVSPETLRRWMRTLDSSHPSTHDPGAA